MQVFIDESGIHKSHAQSTIALVYVTTDNLVGFDNAVEDLESLLKIPGFHWSEYSWKIRQSFFQGLVSIPFTVKAVLLQNPFSERKFELSLLQLLTESKIKKIVIDGSKPIRYILGLKKALRQQKISVNKIRTGKDTAFPGLRVADAFAGIIRAANEKDNIKAKNLCSIVANKIAILSDGPVSG